MVDACHPRASGDLCVDSHFRGNDISGLETVLKAISFDADGTLLGTFPESPRGFENFFLNAAKEHGKPLSLAELEPILHSLQHELRRRRKQGFNPYASEEHIRKLWLWYYEQVFTACNLPQPESLALTMLERFESGEFTGLYSDTLPCLEYFLQKNVPMILISNYAAILEKFLADLGIKHFFNATLISAIEGVEKPSLQIYRRGAEKLKLKPHEILHVGNDLDEDYHGAVAAGYQAVLLDRDGACNDPSIPKIHSLKELFAGAG